MVELGIDGSTGEGVEKTVKYCLSLFLCMSNECLCRDERDSNAELSFSLDKGKGKRCLVKLNLSFISKEPFGN